MTLKKLKNIPVLKNSTVIPSTQVVLILKDDFNVLKTINDEWYMHIFIEHIARGEISINNHAKTRKTEVAHESAHHWLNHVRCKPNPDYADPTSMINYPQQMSFLERCTLTW
jgi:hypothetical protein